MIAISMRRLNGWLVTMPRRTGEGSEGFTGRATPCIGKGGIGGGIGQNGGAYTGMGDLFICSPYHI